MISLTVSAYNRPEMLSQSLASLSRCVGISSARVFVLCDRSDSTDECLRISNEFGFECFASDTRLGCNKNIKTCLYAGLNLMREDFHVHIEDDIVLCRDAIQWFSWARDTYRRDRSIFTVAGYHRAGNGRIDECSRRRWFSSWGWGTWADRLEEIVGSINEESPVSWDIQAQEARKTRFEVFPTVSRAQNIGGTGGEHISDPDHHAAFVMARQTSDSLDGLHLDDFREVWP